eukprot:scaffold8073_cov127-Amphora_coffeaeformis.AAC.2
MTKKEELSPSPLELTRTREGQCPPRWHRQPQYLRRWQLDTSWGFANVGIITVLASGGLGRCVRRKIRRCMHTTENGTHLRVIMYVALPYQSAEERTKCNLRNPGKTKKPLP